MTTVKTDTAPSAHANPQAAAKYYCRCTGEPLQFGHVGQMLRRKLVLFARSLQRLDPVQRGIARRQFAVLNTVHERAVIAMRRFQRMDASPHRERLSLAGRGRIAARTRVAFA